MKKPIVYLMGTVLVTGIVMAAAGCGGSGEPLAYHYYKSEMNADGNLTEQDYDHSAVYQNDLTTLGADPSAIYITEGPEQGYYYMYNTSDPIGATGYLAYRSKNLNDWECMGVAYNPTMYREGDVTYMAFATAMYWAPEVIYDQSLGLYFMFYNASYMFHPYEFYIDVAVSENPQGPFTQYAKWICDSETATADEKAEWAPVEDPEAAYHANLPSNKLKIFRPLLDFTKVPAEDYGDPETAEDDKNILDPSWFMGDTAYVKKGDQIGKTEANEPILAERSELPCYMKVIDASPFIDEDGEKYLYFVQDLGDRFTESSICVIKMNDDWTPDYTQMKKLTLANQYEMGDNKHAPGYADIGEGIVNEAPFMVRHGSKYYLLYSANSYTQTSYSVRVAVGDSPMGPFRKLKRDEGGWLLYRAGQWMSGTGHNSFVTANGNTYVVYHAHTNRSIGGGARAIAFDEIQWVENDNGLVVPHANGPTYSHMPLTTAEWKNIAGDAVVTCSELAEGADVKYLTDGIIKIHNDTSYVKEFDLTTKKTVITLEFEDYREITALFIANAYDYDHSVEEISKVEFEYKNGNKKGTKYTDVLEYDYDKYYPGEEYYVTGGTFAIEFEPMLVKSIKITLPKVSYERALSEIMVLGK